VNNVLNLYLHNKNMRKFKVSVLLSSGTTGWTMDYTIDNVSSFVTSSGYYFIMTPNRKYYFPISRTIIEEIIEE
jgi:hypothetical protein